MTSHVPIPQCQALLHGFPRELRSTGRCFQVSLWSGDGLEVLLWFFIIFFFSIFAVLGLLGCVGSALCWGVQASHSSDVSCRGAQALGCGASVVEACGLSGGGSEALERGLNRSCSAACGIFLDQGLNLSPLRWQVDSLPLSHQGSPYRYFLNKPLFL